MGDLYLIGIYTVCGLVLVSLVAGGMIGGRSAPWTEPYVPASHDH